MMKPDDDNVFLSFFRKITNIVERQRSNEPDIIRRNRWHITTLLNTFNTYHCYDIHYDYMKEIDPFWFSIMDKDRLSEVRLMAISIDKNEFVFWVDHERGILPLTYVDFAPLVRRIIRGKTKTYQHEGRHEFILYKSYGTTPRYAPPLSNNVFYVNSDVYCEPQGSAFFIEWHVNMKYVPRSRTTKSDDVLHAKPPTPFVLPPLPETDKRSAEDRVIPGYVTYIKTYLFGSDWSFIEENFRDDVYTPTTMLEWTLEIERELGKYGVLDKFIFSHDVVNGNLESHNDTTFKERLAKELENCNSRLMAYDDIIIDILGIIGDKSIDTIRRTPENTDYMTLDRDMMEFMLYNKKREIAVTEYIIDDTVRSIKNLLSS